MAGQGGWLLYKRFVELLVVWVQLQMVAVDQTPKVGHIGLRKYLYCFIRTESVLSIEKEMFSSSIIMTVYFTKSSSIKFGEEKRHVTSGLALWRRDVGAIGILFAGVLWLRLDVGYLALVFIISI